jgi:ankyrin repeat protein
VHTADTNGWTLLHAASRRGHLGVVKLLLRPGADVDVLNKAGRSAAELASESGQAEVAKCISEYKANANTRNKLLSTTLDTVEYGTARKTMGKTKQRFCCTQPRKRGTLTP